MKKNTQRSFISLLVSIALCLGICTLTASANTEATRDTWDASLQGEAAWAMAGANPERTSYTTEQINNPVQPIWYKPFAAYIPQRVQIIAAGGRLYVSTAKGLYALNANTGAEEWVFPTELPLGALTDHLPKRGVRRRFGPQPVCHQCPNRPVVVVVCRQCWF
jgi:hypothetical protein